MCGIVGYTGNKACLPILLESLRALEYRGYDSAGISLVEKDGRAICTLKSVGGIDLLERKISDAKLDTGICGIGHTRWATHGAPSDSNAHPHTAESLTLVHNGIIENHAELETLLLREGYNFYSSTDTERAAKLIDLLYKRTKDPLFTLFEAQKMLVGSYAFGIIFKDRPTSVYAMRKNSPLVVATDESGSYLASDVTAILPYTDSFAVLDEGIVAELCEDGAKFYSSPFCLCEQSFQKVSWSAEQAQKGGFEHFMLKEINEEPSVISATLSHHLDSTLPGLKNIERLISGLSHIYIVACGTAMHAGLVGKYYIERIAKIPVSVEIASEFRYADSPLHKGSLAIFISQSGETADTLAALRRAKELGISTLAIVNVFASSVAREADEVLYTQAGPEISVASTKAYSAQCSLLALLAVKLGITNFSLSTQKAEEYCKRLSDELASSISSVLQKSEEIAKISSKLLTAEHLFYIGRGVDYYLALEASLKLKEISYIHSEAYPAGELKHGTISLISKGTQVIGILTDPSLAPKTLLSLHEVLSRGARLTLICTERILRENSIPDANIITVPDGDRILRPISTACALQLLAYHTAAKKGLDVDKPRNLAKSVTVE
ncbi:MAG: glutamine--fructose-6-phosphate transaminase (isomerizing) [Ruminococcaceae bacterium]|nr:glutamine--fructose-6-phosphate transaminase (isomerizing) [Oscillospiraceae bacterium]